MKATIYILDDEITAAILKVNAIEHCSGDVEIINGTKTKTYSIGISEKTIGDNYGLKQSLLDIEKTDNYATENEDLRLVKFETDKIEIRGY